MPISTSLSHSLKPASLGHKSGSAAGTIQALPRSGQFLRWAVHHQRAKGESNSGMPFNIHASDQAKLAAPEAGLTLGESAIGFPVSAEAYPSFAMYQSSAGSETFECSVCEFLKFVIAFILSTPFITKFKNSCSDAPASTPPVQETDLGGPSISATARRRRANVPAPGSSLIKTPVFQVFIKGCGR